MKINGFFILIFTFFQFFIKTNDDLCLINRDYFSILPDEVNLNIFKKLIIDENCCLSFKNIDNAIKNYTKVNKLFKKFVNKCLVKQFEDYRFITKNNIAYCAINLNCNYFALFLIENFLDINCVDDKDNNLLIYVASINRIGLLKLLINLFANNIRWDILKKTFISAIVNSRINNINFLLDYINSKPLVFRHYILNVKDSQGLTPLMYSVEHRLNKVIEVLIDMGANMKIKNNLNQDCIDIARAYGYDETFNLLLRRSRNENGKYNFIDQEV